MTKQVFSALGVLIILIISQVVWFNQLWELDKRRLQTEISSELSSEINYLSLKEAFPKNSTSKNPGKIKIGGEVKKVEKNPIIAGEITTDHYDSGKSMAKMVENAFLDINLTKGKIKTKFIDSVFHKSYPKIKEVSFYSLKLYKNTHCIDSISYGSKPISSPFNIDIPLGSKKIYHFKADVNLKPSVQIRNMLFSIGITSLAIILVAVFMIFQLILLRKRTLQLQWREKSVSGIIHDLKSPLSYVYTMLGFFESTEKETARQQNLNTAKTRVKYLSDKIEMLLSAFKSSKKMLVMNKSEYHFTERCTELMEELKQIYKDKIINFGVHTLAGFSLNVDAVYFEGCVRNLLDNAVKYSHENVEISISSELKNNRVYLYFKDSGRGIPKNMQKKVFREFYRDSVSGDIKGHGIGLSFTKQIVEAHKGKIYLKNNGGNGTTFVIELPVN